MSESIVRDRAPKIKLKEPGITGLLTDAQHTDLARIRTALWTIEDLIVSVNTIAADAGLPIRPLSNLDARLAANDISRIVFAHLATEDRIKTAAFAAVERAAA